MIAAMTKVQIAVPSPQRETLLRWLQEQSIMHLTPLTTAPEATQTDTAYQLAEVQFGLEFIQRIRAELQQQPRRRFKNIFATKPQATLAQLEANMSELKLQQLLEDMHRLADQLTNLTARTEQLKQEIARYTPWQNLHLTGQQLERTPHVAHALYVVSAAQELRFRENLNSIPTAIWQEVHRVVDKKRGTLYFEVVVHQQDRAELDQLYTTAGAERVTLQLKPNQTPAVHLADLHESFTDTEEDYQQTLKVAARYIRLEKKLQFAYDALLHRQERENATTTAASSSLAFVTAGWLPKHLLPNVQRTLDNDIPAAAIVEAAPTADEPPPIMFRNSKWLTPFESVTNIYGKPRYTELDPSPILALFFLVAFGLALTDAGYGLILMASTWGAQRFFRLKKDLRRMLQLLLYAGAATTIIGALTGGWFGLTLEELPPSAIRDALLSIKLIDPISSPLTLLLVAFIVGIIQLLFAWGVKAYDLWRNGQKFAALVDAVAWITMVVLILAWASIKQGLLPPGIEQPIVLTMTANAILLIATQGRQHKNILLRLGAGLISLYGLVSFLSDVLSYSRLLALGLATGIIGLVVNLIAGMVNDMIPVIGIGLAVVVLIGGHLFNLGINSLGAFIHSGRLQFVEFFPKFMEGGGVPFKPFGRVSRYVDNPADF